MGKKILYKIKDSVDLFLSDEKFIVAYYMNTRQRKTFKVNRNFIFLLENIDGKNNLSMLQKIMKEKYGIEEEEIEIILSSLLKNKIITEVNFENDILNLDDLNRFDRQINYFSEFLENEVEGIKAQKKLMDSHVLILGCGAIGGDIAIELAMAGVRKFTLLDYDTVEESDISRHMYYSFDKIGEKKVKILKNQILNIDKKIEVNCIEVAVTPTYDLEETIEKADFIINTLDEPYIGYTSAKISRICIKKDKPHFVAGGFDAHLASTGEIVIPHITPCVECYSQYFKEKLKGWKPKEHPVDNVQRTLEIGGLSSMSLFSASFAVVEIIKYLAGIVNFESNFKVRGEFLFDSMNLTYINIERDKNCLICGDDEKK